MRDEHDTMLDRGEVFSFEQQRRARLVARIRSENTARREELADDIVNDVFTRPIESRNDRDRREIAEQEAKWKREREAEQKRKAATPDRIAALIAAERRFIAEIISNVVAEERAASARRERELRGKLETMRSLVVETNQTIVELCDAMIEPSTRNSAKVVDITPVRRVK
jgi:hypothetical protein